MAARSEQQLEYGKVVGCHPLSLIFFSHKLCLMVWKNTIEWLAHVAERTITNLWFANDTDTPFEEEQKQEALAESLDETCTSYRMEISAESTKLMTNSTQREIKIQKLDTVTGFKTLGAVVSDDGSKPGVLSRIAQATAALTKLKPIWYGNNISLDSKVKLNGTVQEKRRRGRHRKR